MRTKLEPPTSEEMLAYTRGELNEAEADRVRERLAYHPDLARTLTVAFPNEGAEPGDPDYLADDEFAAHWAALEKRRRAVTPIRRPERVWQYATAVAAALAVIFGVMFWRTNERRYEPAILAGDPQILFPNARRGTPPAQPPALAQEGDVAALMLTLVGQRNYDRYRIEIVDVSTREAVWHTRNAPRREDDSFVVLIPRRFLRPGTYELAIYGAVGAGEEQLASYSLRVPRPPGK